MIDVGTIRDALTLGRGDIFLAAHYLGTTARELDSFIKSSDDLQVFVLAIADFKENSDYKGMSTAQFREQFEYLTRSYRVEGLEVIHELATMPFEVAEHRDPITDELIPAGTITAAMAKVKLEAAIQLRGVGDATGINGDHALALQEMNTLYQTMAPRIKSIRREVIEFDTGTQVLVLDES